MPTSNKIIHKGTNIGNIIGKITIAITVHIEAAIPTEIILKVPRIKNRMIETHNKVVVATKTPHAIPVISRVSPRNGEIICQPITNKRIATIERINGQLEFLRLTSISMKPPLINTQLVIVACSNASWEG
jgi:hypothetical protein